MSEQFRMKLEVPQHRRARRLLIVVTCTVALCMPALSRVPFALAAPTQPVAPSERRLLDQAIGGRCVPDAAKDVLRAYRERIVSAPTVEEARALVFSQTRLVHAALNTAAWVLPFSDSVREAREKIETLESRVYAATTQTEVADDVSDLVAPKAREAALSDAASHMVLAGVDLNESAVRTGKGGGGCDYTTGEIVIIVLGFLLFIIPGIIFLIIFC